MHQLKINICLIKILKTRYYFRSRIKQHSTIDVNWAPVVRFVLTQHFQLLTQFITLDIFISTIIIMMKILSLLVVFVSTFMFGIENLRSSTQIWQKSIEWFSSSPKKKINILEKIKSMVLFFD